MPARRNPFCLHATLAAAMVVLFVAVSAFAQSGGPRTLEELKEETQRRQLGLKSEDVREALANIHSLDRDEWAAAWSAIAARYDKRAKSEEARKDSKAAQADYRMAWRYYNFARWPVPNSPGKEKAYQNALVAFRNYARFLDPPLEIVRIPFEGKEIIGYLRLPKDVRPAPLVLTISGGDTRKEDGVDGDAGLIASGIGFFAEEMPGTGEMPIKADVGAERVFSRILDYLATRPDVDSNRIVVRGGSWGGYWAAKLAYVERNRLRGAVLAGGPVDGYYTAEWQRKSLTTPEYLFDLFASRSSAYGVNTLDEFLAYGPRMSLKQEGWLGKPSAPMLIINGAKDSQVPISDLYLLLNSGGSPKEAWVNPDGEHTGRSEEWPGSRITEEIVMPWIKARLNAASKPVRSTTTSSSLR